MAVDEAGKAWPRWKRTSNPWLGKQSRISFAATRTGSSVRPMGGGARQGTRQQAHANRRGFKPLDGRFGFVHGGAHRCGAQIWRGLNNNTRLFFWPRLFVLAEAVGDERRDCLHCLCRLGASRGNGDGHSRPGAQSQNAHDRGPADGFPATAECDRDIEPIDTLHEFRRRARVEPLAIDDFKGAYKGIPGWFEIWTIIAGLRWDGMVFDHIPLNTLLAT